jgi:hypothetical protein
MNTCQLPPNDPAVIQDVQRRTELLAQQGKAPEWLFYCGTQCNQPLACNVGQKAVLLFFTSGPAALDYIRTASRWRCLWNT